MENKIINGGAGSGDFGHAGREGLVGGSEPVESRKKRGFKSKSERKEVKKEESKNKYHNFLEYKINESWYKNAKQDYGVDGKLLDTSLKDDTLTIKWEEKEPNKDKKQYKMEIPYASDYSNEQLYAIWQDQSLEVEEITDKKSTKEVKKEEKQERAEQMRLFNGKKANNSLYKHEFIEY